MLKDNTSIETKFKLIEENRKKRILLYLSVIVFILMITYSILNLLINEDVLLFTIEILTSIIALSVFILRKKFFKGCSYLFVITLGFNVAVLFLNGGFHNSGILWTFGYLFVTFPLLGRVKGAIAYYSVLFVNLVIFVLSLFKVVSLPIERNFIIIYLIVYFLFGMMLYKQESYRKKTEIIIKSLAKDSDILAHDLKQHMKTMNEELEMAKNIQEAIIPKVFPKSENIDISGSYIPMSGLGGDYYDVIEIEDSRLAFVIADVSGHGVPSALISSMAKVLFVNNSKQNRSTGEIIEAVNKELYYAIRTGDYPTSFYLTAFYCIIDIERKTLEYTNAGHNNVYILKNNNVLRELQSNAPIIGVFDKLKFNTNYEKISLGDKLILYTDGLTEAINDKGEFLGVDRLKNLFLNFSELPAKELVNQIIKYVDSFTNKAPITDDRTILIADIVSDKSKLIMDLGIAKEDQERVLGDDETSNKFKLMNEKFSSAVDSFTKGAYDETEKLLSELYNKYNRKMDNLRVLNLLGFTYYKLGKYEKAIGVWREALSLHPHDETIFRNIKYLKDKIESN